MERNKQRGGGGQDEVVEGGRMGRGGRQDEVREGGSTRWGRGTG